MPQTAISLDLTPISAIAELIKAVGSVVQTIGEVSMRHRETMSQANRDRMDAVWVNGLERWDRLGSQVDAFLALPTPPK